MEEPDKSENAEVDGPTAALRIVRYLRDHRPEVFRKGHRGDDLALFLAEEG